MADNTLDVIFKLRYDTYNHWMNSDAILMSGEAAIAAFPNTINPLLPPQAIGIKIGDGRHYFDELPWIQAIASDVYSWAKTSSPPAADTIPGLAEFIEAHSGGGGSGGGGSISSGSYQIIYDNNTKKYILQQFNSDTNTWEDTTSSIDFSGVLNRLDTIERWANGAKRNLGNIELPLEEYIYSEVVNYLNILDYNDQAVEHQFVTSVRQVDGQIEVTRSILSANDIDGGILPSQYGGTGFNFIDEDETLAGSLNGTLVKKKIVTEIGNTQRGAFATVGAIKDYVDEKTLGITGAMHFVGESNILITNNGRTDPQIVGYNFRNAQPGDVILANNAQEFVWTGSSWRLLGDEGSYAVKGSIVNADISEEAAIAQSKIAGLTESLESKVDKVEGKSLSSNDYTDEEQQKLQDIEYNAQENVIEHVFFNDEEMMPTIVDGLEKSISVHFNGMSQEQSDKLDTIEEGAQVNSIEQIKLNGTPIPPDNNKAVDIQLIEYTQEEKDKLETVEEGAQVNTINTIIMDGEEQEPDEEGVLTLTSAAHTDHINKIEHIFVNGSEITPTTINDEPKSVNVVIDPSALQLQVLEGARYPTGINTYADVDITNKKLELAKVAATGEISHLVQQQNTYIILNCGSSVTVI